jgi:hypothetical protein
MKEEFMFNHSRHSRNDCPACDALFEAWTRTFGEQFCIGGTAHLDIGDLARDSTAMRRMCGAAKRAALRKVATLAAALAVDIDLEGEDAPRRSDDTSWSLSADEAAKKLGKSRRWLFRHANGLPFARRVSRKTLVCDEAGLNRWVANRPRK